MLATVWVSGTKWADENVARDLRSDEVFHSSLRFSLSKHTPTRGTEMTGDSGTVIGGPRKLDLTRVAPFATESMRSERFAHADEIASADLGRKKTEYELDNTV